MTCRIVISLRTVPISTDNNPHLVCPNCGGGGIDCFQFDGIKSLYVKPSCWDYQESSRLVLKISTVVRAQNSFFCCQVHRDITSSGIYSGCCLMIFSPLNNILHFSAKYLAWRRKLRRVSISREKVCDTRCNEHVYISYCTEMASRPQAIDHCYTWFRNQKQLVGDWLQYQNYIYSHKPWRKAHILLWNLHIYLLNFQANSVDRWVVFSFILEWLIANNWWVFSKKKNFTIMRQPQL